VQAYEGHRWVAAWSQADERFGQTLSANLVPGTRYRLSCRLHRALRADLNNAGSYAVGLAADVTMTTTVALGSFAFTSTQGWDARSFEFVAPADASTLPLLFFISIAGPSSSSYAGIDAVELVSCN